MLYLECLSVVHFEPQVSLAWKLCGRPYVCGFIFEFNLYSNLLECVKIFNGFSLFWHFSLDVYIPDLYEILILIEQEVILTVYAFLLRS